VVANIRNIIKSYLVILLTLPQFACCVIEELEFDKKTLTDAVLNQEYKVIITASVKNNPNDDNFNYEFKLSGSLPDGLVFTKDLKNRRVIISGTPIAQGSYILTLQGKVRDSYNPDEESDDIFLEITFDVAEGIACSNRYEHEQTYTLNVNIM